MTLTLTSTRTLRVVPDASVLVSALLSPKGPSGRTLRRFLEEDEFELILTDEISAEFRRALGDRRVRRHLRVGVGDIARLTTAITLLATFVEPRRALGPGASIPPGTESADPHQGAAPADGEAKYLAAARAAAPCLLVTLEPSLLAAPCPDGVEIVSPRVLLELLEVARIEGNSRSVHAFT